VPRAGDERGEEAVELVHGLGEGAVREGLRGLDEFPQELTQSWSRRLFEELRRFRTGT